MTTRRQFLADATALVTGAVALEAYERLHWTRRFWSLGRPAQTFRVASADECASAVALAWRGDTILLEPGMTIDSTRLFAPVVPKGPRWGGMVLVTSAAFAGSDKLTLWREEAARAYPTGDKHTLLTNTRWGWAGGAPSPHQRFWELL